MRKGPCLSCCLRSAVPDERGDRVVKGNNQYKTESKKFFNRVCNRRHGNSRKLHEFLLQHHPAGNRSTVLDAGCGDGRFFEQLWTTGSGVALHGADLSENMIGVARTKAIPNASFVIGDAEALPYADAYFDTIYCLNSFHHYPCPDRVARECHRLLKPGGTLIIGEVYVMPGLRQVINRLLPLGWTGDYRMYAKTSLNTLMGHEGFMSEQYTRVSFTLFVAAYTKR